MNQRLLSFMNCLLLIINREILVNLKGSYFIEKVSKFLYYLIENNLLHEIMLGNFEAILINLLINLIE